LKKTPENPNLLIHDFSIPELPVLPAAVVDDDDTINTDVPGDDSAGYDPSATKLTSFLNDNVIDYSTSSYHSILTKMKHFVGRLSSKQWDTSRQRLFLVTLSSHQDIHVEVMMNGLITSTPYIGTQA
jgi:hypothetical protein